MFKGKQIKRLEEKTSELEKLLNETKESLNQMSASRFDSISQELKDFNNKVGTSSTTLEKVQKDLGELDQVTSQIAELNKKISTFNDGMDKVRAEFAETQAVVQRIKDELTEERTKVVESNEKLVKQEVILNEKSGQLERLEKEVRESKGLVGKLEAQRDNFERELNEVKANRDQQYKELTRVQDELTKIKKEAEDHFAYSGSVRKFLESTTEGKIILALSKTSPQTFDELAEKIGESAVRVKQALNVLRDQQVVTVNDESRSASI